LRFKEDWDSFFDDIEQGLDVDGQEVRRKSYNEGSLHQLNSLLTLYLWKCGGSNSIIHSDLVQEALQKLPIKDRISSIIKYIDGSSRPLWGWGQLSILILSSEITDIKSLVDELIINQMRREWYLDYFSRDGSYNEVGSEQELLGKIICAAVFVESYIELFDTVESMIKYGDIKFNITERYKTCCRVATKPHQSALAFRIRALWKQLGVHPGGSVKHEGNVNFMFHSKIINDVVIIMILNC